MSESPLIYSTHSNKFEEPIIMVPTSALVPQTTGSGITRADPWKEDGNIILAAKGNYFRVHRSVLSDHSEIFKDMFDCPHSTEVEKELIDHCPVIHLHDAPTDVQIMLKAMYDRSFPLPCYERMPISLVSTFLRMGEKYAVSALTKEAKAKLCCAFEPTSVACAPFLSPPFPSTLFPAITDGDPHNFQIMNLLQEMDLKAPLPLALYQCIIRCPLTKIVDGYRFSDSFYSLSPANLRSFIRMKDILENHRILLAKILCTSPACTQPSCASLVPRLWSEDMIVLPPFDHWKSEWDKQFCESCAAFLRAKRDVARHKAWDQLPTAFGFTSWTEVKSSGDFPSLTIRAS